MTNNTKGIALVAVAAIMLVGATIVSLAPVASVRASSISSSISISVETEQSLQSGQKDNIVTSNDASENSAASAY